MTALLTLTGLALCAFALTQPDPPLTYLWVPGFVALSGAYMRSQHHKHARSRPGYIHDQEHR